MLNFRAPGLSLLTYETLGAFSVNYQKIIINNLQINKHRTLTQISYCMSRAIANPCCPEPTGTFTTATLELCTESKN